MPEPADCNPRYDANLEGKGVHGRLRRELPQRNSSQSEGYYGRAVAQRESCFRPGASGCKETIYVNKQ